MADIAYRLAAFASPKPLPPGTSEYGPLTYLLWAVEGLFLLACLCFAARAVVKLTRRHPGR